MSLIKSKIPEHGERQLETDENPLPEGVIVTGNQAVISDKSLALAVYDNDCAVFVTDENGKLQLLTDRNDIINHSGTYTVATADLELVLERDRQLEQEKPQEKSESEVFKEKQELALAEISALTGVSISQLQALPDDVKDDVLQLYARNGGTQSEQLKEDLNLLLVGAPSITTQSKENHLKTTEELIEGNYNSIDGVINNLPSDTEKPSVLAALKELGGGHSVPPMSHSLDIGGDERQR
ncbi:MAG: DUF4316 domain-containing protein [Oscillospiraceae bacterium]|nr:DUF4316 domain-containing protein [Oscillospiraceae bacterium]